VPAPSTEAGRTFWLGCKHISNGAVISVFGRSNDRR